ncbi:MAG: hypothetical protein LBT05_01890, partial [Planctomycetaceae bacterium]|nr:hypothetical protein [Planctomycetaceae bacterium]
MDFKTIAFTFGIIALPVLQIMPDVSFLQGLEKVGIIGFLSLVMIWLVWERRFFMTKTTSQMITMQTRLTDLENKVA